MTPIPLTLVDALAILVEQGKVWSAWIPGMLDSFGDRVLVVGPEGRLTTDELTDFPGRVDCSPAIMGAPDLDDPLTVQGLLLLLREALDHEAFTHPWYDHVEGTSGWSVRVEYKNHTESWDRATEAEALTAALIDAALEAQA